MENWNWETIFYGYYRSCSLLFKFGILRFWAPFGGLGTTYDVHLGLIGKHVVDFRFPVTFGQNLSTQQSHCLFATAKLLVKLLSLVGWNYTRIEIGRVVAKSSQSCCMGDSLVSHVWYCVFLLTLTCSCWLASPRRCTLTVGGPRWPRRPTCAVDSFQLRPVPCMWSDNLGRTPTGSAN